VSVVAVSVVAVYVVTVWMGAVSVGGNCSQLLLLVLQYFFRCRSLRYFRLCVCFTISLTIHDTLELR
jgi:hypothetical protein